MRKKLNYQITLVGRDRQRINLEAPKAPERITLPFDDEGKVNFSAPAAAWRQFVRTDRGEDWANYEEAGC